MCICVCIPSRLACHMPWQVDCCCQSSPLATYTLQRATRIHIALAKFAFWLIILVFACLYCKTPFAQYPICQPINMTLTPAPSPAPTSTSTPFLTPTPTLRGPTTVVVAIVLICDNLWDCSGVRGNATSNRIAMLDNHLFVVPTNGNHN